MLSNLILKLVKIDVNKFKMKKIFLILVLQLSFTTFSFACSCISQKLDSHFSESDFVGEIEIIKNYKNISDSEYYKIDILVRKLYKGNIINSITAYGSNGGIWESSSCDILIPEKTKLIVFARQNEEGQLQLGMCSKLIYLDNDKVNEKTNTIVKVLETLKRKKIFYKSIIYKYFSPKFEKFFREQPSLKLKKDFAIYEITFKKDLKVKCVRTLSGFKNKIDRKIKRYLKQEVWGVEKKFKDDSITTYNKHFVIVYYNKGRLSEYIYTN